MQKDYPAWEAYLEICTGKTAPLFVAPVEGVAQLAGRADVIPALMRFFTAVGGLIKLPMTFKMLQAQMGLSALLLIWSGVRQMLLL